MCVIAISRYEEMNDMKLDIFKEMGSIGGGNAATALSSMLNARVSMALPRAEILEFNDALARLGDPEIVIAGVLVELTGEIQGIMLFIIPEEFSDEVLFRMLGKTRTALLELDEIESSVLTEIGNIVISSYVTALSSLAGVEVELSVPQLAVNMLGGIMSLPMAMMGQQSDRIMMVTGEFNIDDKALNSGMLLLPDVESLNILMKKLGVD